MMRIYGNSIISGSGSMTVNGIRIDLDDPIGTCKRILSLVPEEDQIEFANEILANAGKITDEQRKKKSSVVKEKRPCKGVTGIDAKGAFNVFFKQGARSSVVVEGKQSQVDKISTTCKGGILYIEQEEPIMSPKSVKIMVVAPKLNNIRMEGSSDFTAQTAITSDDDLEVTTTGSGNVYLPKVECCNIYVNVTASGNITIDEIKASSSEIGVRGSGDVTYKNANISGSTQITVQGSGDIHVYGTLKRVRASVMGSGDINGTINSDNVSASVMGSGDIDLSGHIKNHSKSIMGSGSIHIG